MLTVNDIIHLDDTGFAAAPTFDRTNVRTMKQALPVLICILLCSTATAQLVNGSFEDNGQPSFAGWQSVSGIYSIEPGGAPGGGDWHLRIPFPEDTVIYFFANEVAQVLSGVSSGDALTISFWAKADYVPTPDDWGYFTGWESRVGYLTNTYVGFGFNANGLLDTTWQAYTMDGITIGLPGWQQALRFMGDAFQEGALLIDRVEILNYQPALSTSVTPNAGSAPWYFDASTGAVVLGAAGMSGNVSVLDAAGRVVITSRNAERISTAALHAGVYVATNGLQQLRFVKL